MKINQIKEDKIYNSIIKEKALAPENGHGVSGTAQCAKKDSLVISEKAKSHSEVKGIVSAVINKAEKPASSEKLMRLKSQIASGEYNISSSDIAEKILRQKNGSGII
ncbi:hypothetical protein SDC9_198675 [bioreactor metagenome]|uniref:Anti-sigma-28 factor FlgM C-terminal domain-containing protein n=1 Tax=bioreactor metagenome TaxID=1076179 RepID=A0A645IRL5_9ZZZZ|nr:flagellar biosynthesis anti-sigma factor FlgM [Oscillospiraceae bacterium]